MSCLDVPHIGIGDIPGLSLILPTIVITPPDLSLKLCCNFAVPLPPVPPIPLGVLILALGAGGDALMATIQEVITALNDGLDLLSFNCPLDS